VARRREPSGDSTSFTTDTEGNVYVGEDMAFRDR